MAWVEMGSKEIGVGEGRACLTKAEVREERVSQVEGNPKEPETLTPMLETLDTSHGSGWSKDVAPLNMYCREAEAEECKCGVEQCKCGRGGGACIWGARAEVKQGRCVDRERERAAGAYPHVGDARRVPPRQRLIKRRGSPKHALRRGR